MENLVGNVESIAPWRRSLDRTFIRGIERSVKMVTAHWLALANLANFLFVFLAVLSPALMAAGCPLVAKAIFLVYKGFCHQLPYRSYFVFGYQMAFCQRDFAIYTSMLIAGLAFVFVRNRLRPVDWRLYLALITPMAIDGFTQLFGLRESNWELRTVTGALFGLGTIWLMYPYVEAGMKDARMVLEADLKRTGIEQPADPVGGQLGGGELG